MKVSNVAENKTNCQVKIHKHRLVHKVPRECFVSGYPSDLRVRLARYYRNLEISVWNKTGQFQFLGPKMGYLNLDPDLSATLREIGLIADRKTIAEACQRLKLVDLYLEDTWTGYCLSKCLEQQEDKRVVLVHLDDHADTMAPLLIEDGSGLVSLSDGSRFDPLNSGHWSGGISSGTVGIGNYLTPFFYRLPAFHILHLCDHAPAKASRFGVVRDTIEVPLTLDADPISIGRAGVPSKNFSISYGSMPEALFSQLPEGNLLVHIDLDYFINDFNGISSQPLLVGEKEWDNVIGKMDAFFDAIKKVDRQVLRWMIGASPGFCASRHWAELWNELNKRINDYTRSVQES